jgi:hypothetical protein
LRDILSALAGAWDSIRSNYLLCCVWESDKRVCCTQQSRELKSAERQIAFCLQPINILSQGQAMDLDGYV